MAPIKPDASARPEAHQPARSPEKFKDGSVAARIIWHETR